MKGQRRNNFFSKRIGIGDIHIIPFVFLGGMLEFSSGGVLSGLPRPGRVGRYQRGRRRISSLKVCSMPLSASHCKIYVYEYTIIR